MSTDTESSATSSILFPNGAEIKQLTKLYSTLYSNLVCMDFDWLAEQFIQSVEKYDHLSRVKSHEVVLEWLEMIRGLCLNESDVDMIFPELLAAHNAYHQGYKFGYDDGYQEGYKNGKAAQYGISQITQPVQTTPRVQTPQPTLTPVSATTFTLPQLKKVLKLHSFTYYSLLAFCSEDAAENFRKEARTEKLLTQDVAAERWLDLLRDVDDASVIVRMEEGELFPSIYYLIQTASQATD